MVKGANSTPRMIPFFLTERPIQPKETLQHPKSTHCESQDFIQPVGTAEYHY